MPKICREINEHEIFLLFTLTFITDDLEIKINLLAEKMILEEQENFEKNFFLN